MDVQTILNKNFFSEGNFIPSITIPNKTSDKTIIWNKNYKLYDLSSLYYNSPFYDFIIKIKNSDLGEDEYMWEEGQTVIIPYPLNTTISQLKESFDNYNKIW